MFVSSCGDDDDEGITVRPYRSESEVQISTGSSKKKKQNHISLIFVVSASCLLRSTARKEYFTLRADFHKLRVYFDLHGHRRSR